MKLVPNWQLWWRKWSTWISGLYALVTATMFAHPTILVGLVAIFPMDYRGWFAGALAVLIFVIPVIAVHILQPKLHAKSQGQS